VSILEAIAQRATGNPPQRELPVPELRCYDDEYRTGSRLRSKNWPTRRKLRQQQRARGSLDTSEAEEVEFPPFTSGQIEAIELITAEVEARLSALCSDGRRLGVSSPARSW
jgi:hypothetical protein